MKILIITGGNSSEREISLMSARNAEEEIVKNGHKVKIYDIKGGYKKIINISKDFDILFPILHGEEGEGGKLHKFLNKIYKPIVGTRNYKGMQDAWFKIPFKIYCDENNILTPKWKLIKNENDIKEFGFPCVIKTSNGGSSKEVSIIKSNTDLKKISTHNILKKIAFAEEYLSGIEVTVGILDNKALPLIEIKPTLDSWFSYKTKYDSSTKEIINAPSVDEDIQQETKEIALRIHKHFNLGTYSRIDFIIYEYRPYALELNTIPGLTSESLLPKQAKAAGFNFSEFLEILIKSAK